MFRSAMNSCQINGNVDLSSMERKFLKVYKQLSHLWNPSHPDYNNRHKRNAGYDALLPIFRAYMPKATRIHVRQKINILRSCYRKELRKYLASKTIDADGKVVYTHVPTSWKFPVLRFLDCGEQIENDVDDNTLTETYEEEVDEQNDEVEFLHEIETESGNDEPDTSKIHISPLYVEDDKPQPRKRTLEMSQSFNSENDILEREFNAVGANVACKLQRMTPQQRCHAELLINKVLIKGLKEQLTEDIDLTESWQVEQVSLDYSERRDDTKVEQVGD